MNHFNVLDPNLFISEGGIRNQKKRIREKVLENHKENVKNLQCIKVLNMLMEFWNFKKPRQLCADVTFLES